MCAVKCSLWLSLHLNALCRRFFKELSCAGLPEVASSLLSGLLERAVLLYGSSDYVSSIRRSYYYAFTSTFTIINYLQHKLSICNVSLVSLWETVQLCIFLPCTYVVHFMCEFSESVVVLFHLGLWQRVSCLCVGATQAHLCITNRTLLSTWLFSRIVRMEETICISIWWVLLQQLSTWWNVMQMANIQLKFWCI